MHANTHTHTCHAHTNDTHRTEHAKTAYANASIAQPPTAAKRPHTLTQRRHHAEARTPCDDTVERQRDETTADHKRRRRGGATARDRTSKRRDEPSPRRTRRRRQAARRDEPTDAGQGKGGRQPTVSPHPTRCCRHAAARTTATRCGSPEKRDSHTHVTKQEMARRQSHIRNFVHHPQHIGEQQLGASPSRFTVPPHLQQRSACTHPSS